jgi:hypothetical protein
MPYRTKALQVEAEIARFAEIMVAEGVRSYLEIGSKFGGSLWRVARSLPVGSRIVSVDLPRGTKVWPESERSLMACIAELCRLGYDARVIWGSSTDPDIIARVRRLGPFDAAFIDGDHRLPGLTMDWENYGPMARVIGFHDISWRRAPEWVGTRIDVPEWWNEHKDISRHEEIRLCPTGKNNGIGVLWRT